MLTVYLVPFSEDSETNYTEEQCKQLKQLGIFHGGQYMSTLTKTRNVPKMPACFLFRNAASAEEFEASVKELKSTWK